MNYNYQDAKMESQQEYFGTIHTDNTKTLQNALEQIKEFEKKANKKSLRYNIKYSEDMKLKDMLSRPQDFVKGAIEGIVNLLRQKAYRDGYIDGATENSIQWHKIMDGDLPEDTNVKRVFIGNNEYRRLYYSHGGWVYSDKGGLSFIGNVIAWCEEPQFEE